MDGTIFHYNGKILSSVPSGTTESLYDVWGTSPSNVWAVGNGVIIHYNGLEWSNVQSPTTGAINSIWGSSESDVWAVAGGEFLFHGLPLGSP
jgi:hypothetical protein